MQVKKFEAPTMNEALEMVKNQLGPDAIILNAKDNSRGFGLMGKKSIEITAAISEKQLLEKKYAESRLQENELEKLRARSARSQKEYIQHSVNKYVQKQQERADAKEAEANRRPFTKKRYIDIDDPEDQSYAPAPAPVQPQGRTVEELLQQLNQKNRGFTETQLQVTTQPAGQRVKAAAQNAFKAFQDVDSMPQNFKTQAPAVSGHASLSEVQSLKNEIQTLKNIIQMTQLPRTPDIQLHPGAEKGVSFELSTVYQKLIHAGIHEDLVLGLIQEAKKDLKDMGTRTSLVEGWIAKHMLGEIKIADRDAASPIQLFFGPAGAGKSSHLVKLASYYVIHKNKKVGILSCDADKVGAVDQLRIYAQILNIPFGILNKPEDWASVAQSLQGLDYVLIDYAGSSLRDLEQIEKLKRMLPPENIKCDRHLVFPATFKDSDTSELAERYRLVKPTNVIFNKLDEAVNHGMIYNFQKKFDLPLFTFGIGPQLPEDFEFATKERLVDLIFRISKLTRN